MVFNNWTKRRLEECIIAPPDYGANAPSVEYSPNKPRYIRITDINDYGNLNSEVVSIDNDAAQGHMLSDDDYLFARTGNTVGKTFLYRANYGNCAYAGYLIRFKLNKEILLPEFLEQFTKSGYYWNWIRHKLKPGAQPNINAQQYLSLEINCPPIPIQEKIIKILSTWDEAIEKENEIIKSLRLTRNNLLRQTMKGFSSNKKYPKVKLSELSKAITAGGTPSTKQPEYWENGDIPWMSSGEVSLKFVKEVKGRITKLGLKESSTRMIPENSVLVALAGQGKTRGTVAVNTISLCTNQSLAAIIPNEKLHYLFLFYNLESRYSELRKMSTGEGGRGGLNLQILSNVEVPLSPMNIQINFSKSVFEIDRFIELHLKCRDKYYQQKKGLMQKLLTGKVRVKV